MLFSNVKLIAAFRIAKTLNPVISKFQTFKINKILAFSKFRSNLATD